MANKNLKMAELRQLVREMVEQQLGEAPAPAPAIKPDKETEVAPPKTTPAPKRRTAPNPDKAPDPTPKGQDGSATEMAIANKIADKYNSLSKN